MSTACTVRFSADERVSRCQMSYKAARFSCAPTSWRRHNATILIAFLTVEWK
ncbi:hypothetical protein OESDEN_06051 [Oesophagostomum dentatum]|uniref:Uncharacterized protein n=1 Tax=Oesophagostomum dentatum TaxID=61180 RepID=A0A0B1TF61_OESDE|nr:hypothetical protein OESDEN_06051 [Oesophagostomum dentatum]